MSLNAIMNTAASGLNTAQTQLRVISDNVSNVNTPGYVRKIADQRTLTGSGIGSGVEVARIRLATDAFLQAASMRAGAESARQTVRHELYDRIQSLFGDPGGNNGFFSKIDSLFSAFAASGENPTSSPGRQDALFKAQALFDEAGRISKQIDAARQDADARILGAVQKANSLLEEIEGLNLEIARATATKGDSSGAQSAQSALLSDLSKLMDVQVTQRAIGGVNVRTQSGAILAGQGVGKIAYSSTGTVSSTSAFNEIYVTEPSGQKRALLDGITSGEIKGLVELRDVDAPAAAARLAELVSHVADELNRAHNANTAVPAPNRLSGRNVGQSLPTALTGFTGQTTIAVVNAAGVIQTRADIVFSGATMTVNGVAADPTTFLATLNSQLGGATASFVDGKLSIQAPAGSGISIADPAGAASNKAGRGFSHYFGLNDLVSTDTPAIYDTGLTAASTHGFTAGETMSFRFTDQNGVRIRDIEVAVPAGGTVGDLVAALNNATTGVGNYGSFALGTDGSLTFTGAGNPSPTMSVLDDRTRQVPSGVSVSALFGIGEGTRAARADGFTIRSDIRTGPANLALAQLKLGAAAGTPALTSGDGRGALLLADAGQRTTVFQSAGGASGGSMSVSRYASELAGDIGGKAAAAKSRAQTAGALATEASARQVSHEGVNLDEELVLMTTYQQAFNASARMIQAAKELYDTLLGMI